MANPVSNLTELPSTGRGGQFTCAEPSPYVLGNQAVLTCGIGYKQLNQANLSSVKDVQGKLVWDPDHIDCEPLSELIVLPQTGEGGTLQCAHLAPYHYGDVVTLSCEEGYNLPAPFTATVMEKNDTLYWSQSDINCIPVPCGRPFIPQNGSVSDSHFHFPNLFHYVCNGGYELNIPEVVYECTKQGTWTPSIPRHVQCNPVVANVVNPQPNPINAGNVVVVGKPSQPSSSSKPPSTQSSVNPNVTRTVGNHVLFSLLITLIVMISLGIMGYCIYAYKQMIYK